MSSPPLIVNAALTGMVPTKADNAQIPISPAEIMEDAARCRDAGAAIVHLHARDGDGAPTWSADVYAEIIAGIRARCPDVIVCVSTSGRLWNELDRRAEVLDLEDELKPEMASLTLGSLNFPSQASVNEPSVIHALAERMAERGIAPELEVFDFGMVDYAKFLLERGVLRAPLYFNLLLGSLGTLSASPLHLALLAQSLPPGSTWAATGIGRFQFEVNALAIASGGHVRVGLEDSLWLDGAKQRPASNLALVERVVALARANERTIATPDEARALIGLSARADSPTGQTPPS
jgi:3-keto-5-aminohexanoate cleavage enzyme